MAGNLGTTDLRFVLNNQDLDGHLGGVQQFGGTAVVNADGVASWVLTTTGNDQAGSDMFGNYGAYGPYSPLSVTLVDTTIETVQRNQTRTRTVQRIIGGTVRVDTYTATITAPASGNGLTPTSIAGTQGQGQVTIGGTESRTVLVSGGSATAVTPTVANGGIENNPLNPVTIPNTTYEEPVVVTDPVALITGATSAIRPATIQLTDASTAGTNPITSRVWSSSIQTMVDVSQSGLVTAFGALPATITLTVSDAFGNSDSDTHEVSFSNTVFPTIDVTPESLGISGAGGAGTAFTVATTGTNITVSVTGENAGTLASWLTVSPSGAWSADPNPGVARSATIRFTVRDALFQSAFDEVTVSQAEDQECRMVTLVGGSFYVYNAIQCGDTSATNRSASGTTTSCVVLNSVTIINGSATISYGTTECS